MSSTCRERTPYIPMVVGSSHVCWAGSRFDRLSGSAGGRALRGGDSGMGGSGWASTCDERKHLRPHPRRRPGRCEAASIYCVPAPSPDRTQLLACRARPAPRWRSRPATPTRRSRASSSGDPGARAVCARIGVRARRVDGSALYAAIGALAIRRSVRSADVCGCRSGTQTGCSVLGFGYAAVSRITGSFERSDATAPERSDATAPPTGYACHADGLGSGRGWMRRIVPLCVDVHGRGEVAPPGVPPRRCECRIE